MKCKQKIKVIGLIQTPIDYYDFRRVETKKDQSKSKKGHISDICVMFCNHLYTWFLYLSNIKLKSIAKYTHL